MSQPGSTPTPLKIRLRLPPTPTHPTTATSTAPQTQDYNQNYNLGYDADMVATRGSRRRDSDASGSVYTEEANHDDIDADGECPSKPDEGNTKPRARFGRRRTHNEQLVVATCGVILGRATMFGSEGIDGVRVSLGSVCLAIILIYSWQLFLRALFPTEASVPPVLFYDSACILKRHLNNIGDTYFDNCAMPVDPFHAKTKHKETDMFCGQYCNAARFPDLVKNGKWRFNSSAAEMTNAWF